LISLLEILRVSKPILLRSVKPKDPHLFNDIIILKFFNADEERLNILNDNVIIFDENFGKISLLNIAEKYDAAEVANYILDTLKSNNVEVEHLSGERDEEDIKNGSLNIYIDSKYYEIIE
jgi:hypothetical protein